MWTFVRINPRFIENRGFYYRIFVETTEHGTVSVDPTTTAAGVTVALTVNADQNYELTESAVIDAAGGSVAVQNNASFVMPENDVTVYATFEAIANGNLAIYRYIGTGSAQIRLYGN